MKQQVKKIAQFLFFFSMSACFAGDSTSSASPMKKENEEETYWVTAQKDEFTKNDCWWSREEYKAMKLAYHQALKDRENDFEICHQFTTQEGDLVFNKILYPLILSSDFINNSCKILCKVPVRLGYKKRIVRNSLLSLFWQTMLNSSFKNGPLHPNHTIAFFKIDTTNQKNVSQARLKIANEMQKLGFMKSELALQLLAFSFNEANVGLLNVIEALINNFHDYVIALDNKSDLIVEILKNAGEKNIFLKYLESMLMDLVNQARMLKDYHHSYRHMSNDELVFIDQQVEVLMVHLVEKINQTLLLSEEEAGHFLARVKKWLIRMLKPADLILTWEDLYRCCNIEEDEEENIKDYESDDLKVRLINPGFSYGKYLNEQNLPRSKYKKAKNLGTKNNNDLEVKAF